MRINGLPASFLVTACILCLPAIAHCQSAPEVSKTVTEEAARPPIVTVPDAVVTANVPYANSAEHLQTLDIYSPAQAANAPVALFIHGGGWNKRDKDEVSSQPKLFNSAGIIVVSVNYRLVPAVMHPENVQDIASAIAWTSQNISKHGGNPKRIFLIGHSAGAHLAALVATDDRYLAVHSLHRNQLAGVISLDGSAFDIPDRIRNGSEQIAENCRRAFGDDETAQRDGSPINHVSGDIALPPFLLMYLKDESLNHKQSRRFAEVVTAVGGKAKLIHVTEEKTHQSLCDDLGTEHDTTGPLLVEFVRRGTL